MRAEGVSFTHAVELLKRDYFLPPSARGNRRRKSPPCQAAAAVRSDTRMTTSCLHRVVSYYQRTLKESPEAQQYLVKRGLRISGDGRTLPSGLLRSLTGLSGAGRRTAPGADQRGRLEKLGDVPRNSGHEHFRGSIVIPIFNLQGGVGADVRAQDRAQSAAREHPSTCICQGRIVACGTKQALIASKEIILCEALIDALTFWCAGYRNVTTSYGVNGFTDWIKAAFQKHGTRRIYIAYDRDEAGERAAAQHAEELMAMGIECFRVLFPQGHGRQRIRAESNACAEEPRGDAQQSGMAGQRPAAQHGGDRSRQRRAYAGRQQRGATIKPEPLRTNLPAVPAPSSNRRRIKSSS